MRRCVLLTVCFFFLLRKKKQTNLKKENHADRLICIFKCATVMNVFVFGGIWYTSPLKNKTLKTDILNQFQGL